MAPNFFSLEVPKDPAAPVVEGVEPDVAYVTYFVDPGSGTVNGRANDEEGLSWWLYRGHMYLWQDFGVFGAFDPESGWCRVNANGAEPGGVKGVICDVVPSGDDMVAWFALGWIVVLLTGFYLWYWPGVRRWATALVIRRRRGSFAFNLSIHKVIGFIVWVPLTVIAFTGAAFAFPNASKWFENVTPAGRDVELWDAPEDLASADAAGRTPLGVDDIMAVVARDYPDRAVDGVTPPLDEKGTFSAWATRGFSPWTREDSGGNVYMVFDQYSGAVLYDGTPEVGNVFDQAWDDYSFPIHAGDVGGATTRVLWVAVAVTPIALGTSGLVMNRIRHRKRARRVR